MITNTFDRDAFTKNVTCLIMTSVLEIGISKTFFQFEIMENLII